VDSKTQKKIDSNTDNLILKQITKHPVSTTGWGIKVGGSSKFHTIVEFSAYRKFLSIQCPPLAGELKGVVLQNFIQ